MSQSSAYPPEASFRPASGWQFGAAPARPAPPTSITASPLVAALLVGAAYLVMVQGIVTIATVTDPTPAAIVRTAFTWLAGGAALAVLFAIATGRTWLIAATGLVAAADAIAYVVMGALGTSGTADTPVIAVALALSTAGAVLGVLGTVRDRSALRTAALALAALGVVGFYAISVVSPLASGLVDQGLATLVRTMPVAALAVLGSVLLRVPGRTPAVLAGSALAALALAFTISPILSSVAGTPPPVGSGLVIGLRVALVLAAAIVVIVQAARR